MGVDARTVAVVVSAIAAVLALLVAWRAMRASARSATAAERAVSLNAGIAPTLTIAQGGQRELHIDPVSGTVTFWLANWGAGAMRIESAHLVRVEKRGLLGRTQVDTWSERAELGAGAVLPAASSDPALIVEVVIKHFGWGRSLLTPLPDSKEKAQLFLVLKVRALRLGETVRYLAQINYANMRQKWYIREDLELRELPELFRAFGSHKSKY